MSQIRLITEGICKGMKVWEFMIGDVHHGVYFNGEWSDEKCLEWFFRKREASSSSSIGVHLYLE